MSSFVILKGKLTSICDRSWPLNQLILDKKHTLFKKVWSMRGAVGKAAAGVESKLRGHAFFKYCLQFRDFFAVVPYGAILLPGLHMQPL